MGGESGERHDTASRFDRGRPVAPNPDAVLAPLFTGGSGFFLASDKVQVKYEMLRARLVDGLPVSEAVGTWLFAAGVLLVAAAFEQSGWRG